MSVNSKMTAIADAIRSLLGITGTLGLDAMATKLNGITKKAAASYTPGTTDQTINAGQYLSGAQTIKGDANLVPANIAKDVTIFGVKGEHEGGGDAPDTCTIVLKHGGDAKNAYWYAVTRYVDGAFVVDYTYGGGGVVAFPLTITDVVCGSALYVQNTGLVYGDFCTTGNVASTKGSTGNVNMIGLSAVIEVTETPGVTDEITVTFWLD